MKQGSDYSKIKTYFFDHKYLLIILFVSGLLYNGLMWTISYMQGSLINMVVSKSSSDEIIKYSTLFIFLVLFIQFNRFLKRSSVRKLNNNMVKTMREVSIKNIISKPLDFFRNESKGDILTKCISDIEDTAEGVRKILTEIFDTGVALCGYFIFLFILDKKITVFVLFCSFLTFFVAEMFRKKTIMYNKLYKSNMGTFKNKSLILISNELNYRALGLNSYYDKSFDELNKKLEYSSIKVNVYNSIPNHVYKIIAMLSSVFVIYNGALNVINNTWNIGMFLMYFSSFALISKKTSKLGKTVNTIHKSSVSYSRLKPFLKTVKRKPKFEFNEKTTLKLNNASYSIGQFNLPAINLILNEGDLLVVSGKIKSGKTSFIEMLTNLYEYTGSIKVCDQEFNQIKNYETKNVISYKGTTTELFDGNITENVTFNYPVDIDSIFNILDLTSIDLNNKKFSGGEKERIGIARAFSFSSKIVLLDDPFNNLNKDSALKILKKLKRSYKDRILILVSNDENIILEANKVLYLDEKAVVSTPETLLKNNSFFELVKDGQKNV